MAASIDDVISLVNTLAVKVDKMYTISGAGNSNYSQLWQERQLLTQLMIEGMTKQQAIAYIDRINNGERPWRD